MAEGRCLQTRFLDGTHTNPKRERGPRRELPSLTRRVSVSLRFLLGKISRDVVVKFFGIERRIVRAAL
jgi:hypothetical protein